MDTPENTPVIIAIIDGSPSLVSAPSGITVEIHDHDIPNDWDAGDVNGNEPVEDENGRYQRIVLS